MDTGTILAILIVVLSLASSLVTRLLKNAAGRSLENGPAAVTDEDSSEPLQPATVQRQAGSETFATSVRKPEAGTAYNIPDDLLDGGYKSVKDIVEERKRRVPAARQDSPGNRLVIDKKKLVIYSEIMKTKF